VLLGFASISPLAEEIVLVKEEMAQPVQEVSLWGVPIRGVAPFVFVELGGGRIVSGS
jgi:hypothetical protein